MVPKSFDEAADAWHSAHNASAGRATSGVAFLRERESNRWSSCRKSASTRPVIGAFAPPFVWHAVQSPRRGFAVIDAGLAEGRSQWHAKHVAWLTSDVIRAAADE
jgi:hypothetical protein